jgi:hypothetical protein
MLRKGTTTATVFIFCLLHLQCGTGRDSVETLPHAADVPDALNGLTDGITGDRTVEPVDADGELDSVPEPGDVPQDAPDLNDLAFDELDDTEDCPPSICEVGDKKCKYAGTAYIECLEVPGCPGVGGNWSGSFPCPDGLVCVEGVGCTCKHGECESDDDLDEVCGGTLLGPCEEWICVEGCCDTEPVADCCKTGQDCQDCINLDSGDIILCPGVVPEGYVENLCTWDVCLLNQCENTDKADNGQCDDGDTCTIDGCDPVTGECVYECDWDYFL